MDRYDLIIIGGGPAGLAAAISAKEQGVTNLLILERDQELGGILNQCIHNGFGLHTFKEELTGPEYAQRFIDRAAELEVPYKLQTMVLDISEDGGEKTVTAMNRKDGLLILKTKAVILAMGCRERPRGALNIPGYRPAGIYTAGTAQRLVNMEGYMPGREVVILGSGDIGLHYGQKNDPGRGKSESCGRTYALFRRSSEKYCTVSGRFSHSIEIKPYRSRYSGKRAGDRSDAG